MRTKKDMKICCMVFTVIADVLAAALTDQQLKREPRLTAAAHPFKNAAQP